MPRSGHSNINPMNQAPRLRGHSEYDLHIAIKKLAELEWPCTYRNLVTTGGFLFETLCIGGKLSINGQGHVPHEACGGTGHTVPFVALRVEKHLTPDGRRCVHGLHSVCDGRGWVPEPDLEKACWRLYEMGIEATNLDLEPKEGILRAAEEWAKEQYK